ncbi:subtilase family domain-containing protein [Pochonia chlamydosporia 170]|uniref:Subtilase family domain-containing protein n=1 Tax=Pochonia chlamydosporia 170 TaxID=1380566 RepID=A0A179EZR4_METCM|nr:subtilase family domain-containing protein [Pochonia chlamydosporia 170]OAQ58684.1 subtilase family domain-containing protein [Pochonia chlamydosporia 170]
MEVGDSRFDRVDYRYDCILKLILASLEDLVCYRKSETSEDSTDYPRLETIRQEILRLEAQRQERTIIIADECDDECDDELCIELRKPDTEAACKELINSLKALSRIVKDDSEQPSPEEFRTTRKIRPSMALFLHTLFSTISEAWRCACMPNHQAALLLFGNRALGTVDYPVTFTVLLSDGEPRSPTKRWKEAAITVADPSERVNVNPRPRVRFNSQSTTSNVGSSTQINNLCPLIKTSKDRLNLNVSGASLSIRAETQRRLINYEDCEPVSFVAGILENDVLFNHDAKLCLALILSCAFVDFCDGPWFADGWTKTNLYFMQRGDRLFLQPFLVTNMAGNRNRQNPHLTPSMSTRSKKLLQHGILLMEIFQQDSFQHFIGDDRKVHSLEDLAYDWFRSIDWDVCERLVQIVETCIRGELIDICSQPNEISDQEFMRLFWEKILEPLHVDFAVFHGREDPDQVISKLSLPGVEMKSPVAATAKTTELKSAIRKGPIYKLRTLPPLLNPRASHMLRTPSPSPLNHSKLRFFFDVVDCPDPQQARNALQWFKRVDEEVIRERTKRPKEKVAGERGRKFLPSPGRQVRIAVLDTGIDLQNTWIDGESRRIRCWPAGEDHKDNDGHGTHVAYLLLRLAPNALLRVCKVSNTTLLKDAKVDQITKAITHFSTGEARVDIINLSFGFAEYTKDLTPVLEAIRTARKNGVVVFAAAGNDGANQDVFWPAALYSGGDVICISSSNSFGVQSGFNPEIETGRRICTLGEGVPSCQPDLSNPLQVVHRSGTSFATPIAAAIAAVVLAVMDNADYNGFEGDKETLLPRLRTARGMESVLCKTCVARSGSNSSGFSYIAPWFFVDVGDKILVPKVLDILGSIPESPFSY